MAAGPLRRPRAAAAAMGTLLAVLVACGPTFDVPPSTGDGFGGPPPLPSPGGALYGRVLTAGGLAATRSTVSLVQIRPGDTPFAVFSLGFGCLLPNACANRGTARVWSEGAYSFPAQAVQPDLRSVVTAMLAPLDDQWTGPQTSAGISHAPDPKEVPDLGAWEPELTVGATGTELRVRWAPLSVGALSGPEVTHTLDAVLDRTCSPMVRVAGPSRSTEARIDARQFEDGRFHFAVTAETNVAIDGRDIEFAYRSASHPAPVAAGAPPSRGRPCLTDDQGGPLQAVDPCPLTDGDLDRHEQVSYPPCALGAAGLHADPPAGLRRPRGPPAGEPDRVPDAVPVRQGPRRAVDRRPAVRGSRKAGGEGSGQHRGVHGRGAREDREGRLHPGPVQRRGTA